MAYRLRHGSAPRVLGGALLAVATLLATVLGPVVVAAPSPAVAAPAGTAGAEQSGSLAPPGFGAHEQLAPLGAEQAWRYSTGEGVTVAVVDSGVDAQHPDLAGRVLSGRDYVGADDGRVDPVGHGTTVASLIAGRRDDTAIGVAPDARILPVRVLDDDNRYETATTVAEGVVWAVEQGAEVINLSLGGSGYSAPLGDALSFAMANDVVVVACTGNEARDRGSSQVWYPAREPGVVAVSGLTWSDGATPAAWSHSLTGSATVLAASAVVTGAEAGGGYRAVQGTSFASALVAGGAALIRARWPDMSAADVVNRLVATAQDLGQPGRDPTYGFGAVDPAAALTTVIPPVMTNPLDTKARHGTAGFGHAPGSAPEETDAPEVTDSEPGGPSVRTGLVPRRSPEPGQPAGEAADELPVAAGYRPPAAVVWTLVAALVTLLVSAGAVHLRYRRG